MLGLSDVGLQTLALRDGRDVRRAADDHQLRRPADQLHRLRLLSPANPPGNAWSPIWARGDHDDKNIA